MHLTLENVSRSTITSNSLGKLIFSPIPWDALRCWRRALNDRLKKPKRFMNSLVSWYTQERQNQVIIIRTFEIPGLAIRYLIQKFNGLNLTIPSSNLGESRNWITGVLED